MAALSQGRSVSIDVGRDRAWLAFAGWVIFPTWLFSAASAVDALLRILHFVSTSTVIHMPFSSDLLVSDHLLLRSISRAISRCPRTHIYPYLNPLLSFKFDEALPDGRISFHHCPLEQCYSTDHGKDLFFFFWFFFQFIMIDHFVKYKTAHSVIATMSNCYRYFQMCISLVILVISCCGMMKTSLWMASRLWAAFWVAPRWFTPAWGYSVTTVFILYQHMELTRSWAGWFLQEPLVESCTKSLISPGCSVPSDLWSGPGARGSYFRGFCCPFLS